jgi:hypothetical protein
LLLLGQNIQKHLTHLSQSFNQGDLFIITNECLDIRKDANPNLKHLISISAGMYKDIDFSGQDEDSDALSDKIQSDI